MSKNLKLFTDDTSRQTYEQSQEYLEPYVGGVSSSQTSSYNTRNVGKYFIDYTRTEHRLSDFDINNKDVIEVEYLESTGTQYIDTGYIPNANTQLYIEFSISKYHSDLKQATSPFGVRIAYQQNQYVLFCPVNRTNSVYFCYGNLQQIFTKQINLNQKYVCNVNKNAWTLSSNNSTLTTNTFTTAQSANLPNLHLWLFKFNNNNIMPGGDDKLNIYKCTIKENDVLIHDFIPVRVGNTGYMYDKISRALFGNSGTGNFVIGPDKYDAQIQYLQSTGTQYIDLGIKGNNQIDYEIKLLWTNGDYRNVFGSQTADNSNRFTLMVGTRSNRKIYFNSGNSTNEKTYTLTVEERDNPLIIKKVGNAVSVNGTQRATFTNTTYETPRTIHLFNCNNVASSNILFNPFMDKIYYIKIGNLDLIPVRIGNSGYMYDKISGRLFGNSGTGEFTLGPDVV